MIADAARQHPPPTCWRGGAADNQTTTLQNTVLFSVGFGKYRHPIRQNTVLFSVRFCKYRHPSGGPRNGQGGAAGLPWAWGAVAANP